MTLVGRFIFFLILLCELVKTYGDTRMAVVKILHRCEAIVLERKSDECIIVVIFEWISFNKIFI